MKAALLCLLLSGCASSFDGVCGAVGIGQNEHGIAFMRVHCEPVK